MTVKEIFELRKQGRIEEAYDAIRPLYAAHRGRYTTLCMFWTAADVFKLRLDQRRHEEAALILAALKRVLPAIDDKDGKAAAFIQYASRRMASLARRGFPAPTALTGSTGEDNDTPAPTNSQLLHDYPGHLIVSLDDGLIRPDVGLNTPQRRVLDAVRQHPGYRVPQLSASTGIPAKSIERHIAALIARGLIEHRGSKKTGGYYPLKEIKT